MKNLKGVRHKELVVFNTTVVFTSPTNREAQIGVRIFLGWDWPGFDGVQNDLMLFWFTRANRTARVPITAANDGSEPLWRYLFY